MSLQYTEFVEAKTFDDDAFIHKYDFGVYIVLELNFKNDTGKADHDQIRAGMKSSSICIIPLAVMRMTQEY